MKTPSAAWNILVSQITHLPILNQTFVAGSSSEGWSIFKRVYAHQSAAEKARLTQSWYGLNIKDREPTNEYFAKCNVLTSRLSSDGLVVSDKDTKQHFARNLSPAFGVENGILLSIAALTYLMLEDVALSAHEEMDISREQDVRSGTGDEARLGRTTTRVSHSSSRRSTSSTSTSSSSSSHSSTSSSGIQSYRSSSTVCWGGWRELGWRTTAVGDWRQRAWRQWKKRKVWRWSCTSSW